MTAESNSAAGNKSSLADKIISFAPSKKAFICFYILSLLLFAAISLFHEPWLDEAQAWMIARDASFHDMIFVIPHYEGHPPLWYLLLSLPAKLGAPYELSLTVISLLIFAANTYLIMFRSPFKPAARLILPFTYFFFFQYGVIARPYSLVILAFLLAAAAYKSRNEKPLGYVLSLGLMCLMSAFGIVFAGGLAVAWCLQILKKYGIKGIFTDFIKTRVFFSLCLLLALAVSQIMLIIPYDDTFVASDTALTVKSFLGYLWYMIFMLPADALIFGTGFGLTNSLVFTEFSFRDILLMTIMGAVLLLIIADTVKRSGKVLEFILPYSLAAVFGGAVYFMYHHMGLTAVFFVFILWICLDSGEYSRSSSLFDKLGDKVSFISSKNVLAAAVTVCLALGTAWSISAGAVDISNDYSYGKAAAEYIREMGFDKMNVMSSWFCDENEDFTTISAHKQHQAVSIVPYFEENIFFNFNCGDRDMGYILHRLSEESNNAQYEVWRNTVPDILVGEPKLEMVYEGTDIKRSDYILIKTIEYKQVWKLNHASNYLCIYMRKDLFSDRPDIMPENPADYEFIEAYR